MISYLDPWLDKWAAWSRSGKERLGFASQSPIHRMMTSNAATTTAAKARGKRNSQHMRCVESTSKRVHGAVQDDPISEMMEEAVCQLRDKRFREAILLKYGHKFDDETSAKTMGCSRATFKSYLNLAHESLDTYLRAVFGVKHGEVVIELEFLIKLKK